MNENLRPGLPLPPPLRGADLGTFAHRTITQRFPAMVRRVLSAGVLPRPAAQRLEALLAEIPGGPVRPLKDEQAPDAEAWATYIKPYLGQNWLEVPWFFIETYFFRRILEASGYFQSGEGRGVDPYADQKYGALEAARSLLRAMGERLEGWLAADQADSEIARELVCLALWGNQADLSLFPVSGHQPAGHQDAGERQRHTLVDDSQAALNLLESGAGPSRRVDFIMDNAGLELAGDLWLADYLLSGGWAGDVRLHLKPYPTYVSDATIPDVEAALARYLADDHPGLRAHAARLQAHLQGGRLRLTTHFYWTSPLSFWELPGDLRRELAGADLVINKGDANYRRLLGDRCWPFTTPFAAIVSYFPAPLLALRTLKSEVACGLAPGQAERLAGVDPDWLTGGRWGVIQFYQPD